MSLLFKNWFLATSSNSSSGSGSKCNKKSMSQSGNCLALSDDFSESALIRSESAKTILISSSSSSSSESCINSIKSSSTSIPTHHILTSPRLSWQRRYLLLPSYAVIFMAILPFIQGCLYTVGYRVGKRVLKIVFNQ